MRNQNEFNFFVGIDIDDDIYKAAKEAVGDDRYKNMIIKGLASDSSKDVEGEFMEPDGFEIDEFLKSGLLNLEHFTTRKGSPKFWIGEPLEAEVKNNEFFVKGKLWEKHPLARDFWDTLLIMKASGSTRKPGFSIEGKATERHPLNKKRVTKARISHCAVTMSPVNKNSWFDIVKGEQKEDFIECDPVTGTCKYIYEFEKACSTTGEVKKFGITKAFEVEEKETEEDEETKEKAVTVAVAEPLRKESLDSNVKDLISKSLRSKKITPQKAQKLIKKYKV